MAHDDSNTPHRCTKVEDLCRQLSALIATSHDQRGAIDRILSELRAIARRVESRPDVRAAGSTRTLPAGPSRTEG
jgi:hypothetical protein